MEMDEKSILDFTQRCRILWNVYAYYLRYKSLPTKEWHSAALKRVKHPDDYILNGSHAILLQAEHELRNEFFNLWELPKNTLPLEQYISNFEWKNKIKTFRNWCHWHIGQEIPKIQNKD